jgi:hypothetical protein
MSKCEKEIDHFDSQVERLLKHHKELKLAIHNKKNEASLQTELVTQFTLQTVVLWESFLSDLVIAYVLKDPKRALDSIKHKLKHSVSTKFGKEVSKCVKFSNPKIISDLKIRGLLDHKGWNITANNAESLSSIANERLASCYAKQFSLSAEDAEFFNYIICLRNYLSHYSAGSRTELRKAINGISRDENKDLKSSFSQIGTYLKHIIPSNHSRAEYIAERIHVQNVDLA